MTPDLPAFDLDQFLPYRLSVIAHRLSADLAARYRDEHGLSVAEWRVLVHLSQAEAVSVRDIEARVAMEKSKVSRAATRLETAGLISKGINRRDRRLLQLSLTDNGRALMSRLLPLAVDYQARLRARLGDRLDAFCAALDALQEDGE